MNNRRYATPTQDYVLVEFDQPYENKLQLLGLQDTAPDLLLDTSYNPTQHKNIKGKVLGVPAFLSDQTLRIKDPGHPKPKRQVTSDWIQEMNRYGQRYDSSWYSLAGYVPEWDRLSDIDMVVQVGDIAYVDYTCLQPENLVEDTPQRQVYKVRYDNIICVQRGTRSKFIDNILQLVPNLIMVGRYTLAVPDMESWEEITMEVVTATGEVVGLVTAPNPRPKWLRAELKHVDPENTLGLAPGQVLYYVPNADWSVKIGEETFFAIPERDYLAILDPTNNMKPLGDRVVLRPTPAADKTESGIIIPDSAREQTTEGTIDASGPEVKNKELKAGAKVLFAKGAGTPLKVDGVDVIILRESDIYLLL